MTATTERSDAQSLQTNLHWLRTYGRELRKRRERLKAGVTEAGCELVAKEQQIATFEEELRRLGEDKRPADVAMAIGKKPSEATSAVMRTGRRRTRAPFRAASSASPCSTES